MKVNLIPKSIYGSIQYHDNQNQIFASEIDGKWYPTIETTMFDAGFYNIKCMTQFLEGFDKFLEDLSMLSYFQQGNSFIYKGDDPHLKSEIHILDDGFLRITSDMIQDDRSIKQSFKSNDFDKIVDYIVEMLDSLNIDIFASIILSNPEDTPYLIEAKMSSRDLAKNLVRVKSSNIWAYGINIKNRKDKFGDMLIQFKNANGGPGDIYQYFEIPIHNVWRKFIAAPSKGHFFWQYIRNNYKYRKLTGDRKGKLPNAIN